MANRSGGRQRLLAVYEILREFSDEEVPLTKPQICKLLYEEYHLEADQRTLQSDLDCPVSFAQKGTRGFTLPLIPLKIGS